MTKFMTGYDIVVVDGLVHIKPGHMVEFTDPASSSAQQNPQARRGIKADFEAGFDKVADHILRMENLPAGDIHVTTHVSMEDHFRSAILRALQALGLTERQVTIV